MLGELYIYYNLSSFLKDVMKMTDIDIDPFSSHDNTGTQPDVPMGETIPPHQKE